MYAIIDDNGTIHSGGEDEMREAFDSMIMDLDDFKREYEYAHGLAKETQETWESDWEGDLKLIQVIATSR